MSNGNNNDTLSEKGLTESLNLFPTLAFDWDTPVSSVGSPDFPCRAQDGSLFDVEDAVILFRRIDMESSGKITAADLKAWRQKLPLGRSEDSLVQSVFAKARTDKLGPRDFYTALQDDPMLAAELCTQAAVLDFVAGDEQQNEGARPSESMIKAFVCVAKLKLRHLAGAYREVYSQDDSKAATVFRALDGTGTGSVGANEIQGYLVKHANLKGLNEDDVRSLLDAEGGGPAGGGVASEQSALNKKALRQSLSRPDNRNLAALLSRFAQMQQEHAGSNQAAFAPTYDDASKQNSLRKFETKEFESWFKEMDEDRDGYVTSFDLIAWCTSASWQGLVDEGDLESLFHPSLPNFTVSPAKAAQSSSRGLDESTLVAALERRPLLADRLVLVHRYNCIVQAKLLVEASANTALSGAETMAVEASKQKRAQKLADAAISAAQHAVVITKSESFNVGRNLKKSSSHRSFVKDDAVAHELEASMKEAEASDPQGASAQEARRALKERYLAVAERNLKLLSIEVALEVKLVAWREADYYPTQLQEVRALSPLHDDEQHGQERRAAPILNEVSNKGFESSSDRGLQDSRMATL